MTDAPALTPFDAATRARIRDAQLAWFDAWLESDGARRTWVRFVAHARTAILAARPGELVSREAVDALVQEWLSPERIEATVAPAVAELLRAVTQRATLRDESTAELIGPDAARAIEHVAREPNVVSEALVRALLSGPALERAVSDMLFEALDGFSRKVNPFVAEWGLPALLDVLPLIGRGAIKVALQGIQQEFERRLEPETRRFLAGFVRQSLDRAAKEVTARGSEPELVKLRTELTAAALRVPLSEVVWSPDTTLGQRALDAVRTAMAGVAASAVFRDELTRALWSMFDVDASLGEWLKERGIEVPADEPLADALWPTVRRVACCTEVRTVLAEVLDESLGSLG